MSKFNYYAKLDEYFEELQAPKGFGEEIDFRLAVMHNRIHGDSYVQMAVSMGLNSKDLKNLFDEFGGIQAGELVIEFDQDLGFEISNFVWEEGNLGVPIEIVCDLFDVSKSEVLASLGEVGRRRVSNHDQTILRKYGKSIWSDVDIIQALKIAATHQYPLSGTTYDALVEAGEVKGPSKQVVAIRFGTWGKACEAAGIEGLKSVREDYEKTWSRERIQKVMQKFLSQAETGSLSEYSTWAKSTELETPVISTIRHEFGSWDEARAVALEASWERRFRIKRYE